MSNCNEFFVQDIVAIDIYLASDCNLSIPANVPGITSMSITLGTPILTLRTDYSGNVQISEHPSLKITSARSTEGMVYSATLEADVELGMEEAIAAINNKVLNNDVIAVYKLENMTKGFISPLYNTSSLTTEDSYGTSHTGKIKMSCKSLSELITINS